MGLKSGSRDSGLDDDEKEENAEREEGQKSEEEAVDPARQTEPSAGEREEPDHSELDESEAAEVTETGNVEGKTDDGGRVSVDSLPYKLRRGNVNEGREQVPYFLRPEVTEGEEQLKQTLESELGETVYKSDYREAAMVVAQRNPELIAEVLREWGYDLSK